MVLAPAKAAIVDTVENLSEYLTPILKRKIKRIHLNNNVIALCACFGAVDNAYRLLTECPSYFYMTTDKSAKNIKKQ